jgi:hypothetical protein
MKRRAAAINKPTGGTAGAGPLAAKSAYAAMDLDTYKAMASKQAGRDTNDEAVRLQAKMVEKADPPAAKPAATHTVYNFPDDKVFVSKKTAPKSPGTPKQIIEAAKKPGSTERFRSEQGYAQQMGTAPKPLKPGKQRTVSAEDSPNRPKVGPSDPLRQASFLATPASTRTSLPKTQTSFSKKSMVPLEQRMASNGPRRVTSIGNGSSSIVLPVGLRPAKTR